MMGDDPAMEGGAGAGPGGAGESPPRASVRPPGCGGPGIIPRAVKELFREAKAKQDAEGAAIQVGGSARGTRDGGRTEVCGRGVGVAWRMGHGASGTARGAWVGGACFSDLGTVLVTIWRTVLLLRPYVVAAALHAGHCELHGDLQRPPSRPAAALQAHQHAVRGREGRARGREGRVRGRDDTTCGSFKGCPQAHGLTCGLSSVPSS